MATVGGRDPVGGAFQGAYPRVIDLLRKDLNPAGVSR
jgi:hypothetical protein